ncbi:beta-1,3-galactosyltransferase 1-like isoform X2 [Montipora capricornis]
MKAKMVFRKRFTIKVLIVIVSLVAVTHLLVPQLASERGSNSVLPSSLIDPDAHRELQQQQATDERQKVDSEITLVPEMVQNTTLLIIINTIPSHFERRDVLRKTWAKQSHRKFPANHTNTSDLVSDSDVTVSISYFFMLGFDGYSSIDDSVKRESIVHKDILRVNLIETYRSMVNKIILAFEWVTTLDMKPHFVVKADHDVYVKIPELEEWSNTFSASFPSRFYAGYVERNAAVQRQFKSPWYVSRKHFNQETYPPYCLGPFYVFSWNFFLELVNATKTVKPFPVEDAYMAVVAQKLGVEPFNTGTELFNRNRILNRIVLRTPEFKLKIPPGIVLGDSLSNAAIMRIDRLYKQAM